MWRLWDKITQHLHPLWYTPINPYPYNAPLPLLETLLHALLGLAAQYFRPEEPYTIEQIMELLRYESPPDSPTHPRPPPMFYLIPPTPQFTDEGRTVLGCPRLVPAVTDAQLYRNAYPLPHHRRLSVRRLRDRGYCQTINTENLDAQNVRDRRWSLHGRGPWPGPSRRELSPQRVLLDVLLKSAIRRHERQLQRAERELPRRYSRRSPLPWEVRASQRCQLQEDARPPQDFPIMAEERQSRRIEQLFQLLEEERPVVRSRPPQEQDERSQQRHLQREEMRNRPWHAIAPPRGEMPDLVPALRPQRDSSPSLPLLIPLRTEDELPQRPWTVRKQRRPTLWPETSSPQRILLQPSQRASQRLHLNQESRAIRRPSERPGMRMSRSPQMIRGVMEEPRPPRRLVLLLPLREEASFPQRLVVRFPSGEDGMPERPPIHFRLMDDNDSSEEPEAFPIIAEDRHPQRPTEHIQQVAQGRPAQRPSPNNVRMEDNIRELPPELLHLIEGERHVQRPGVHVPRVAEERPDPRPPLNIQWMGGEMRDLPEELMPLVAEMRRTPSPVPHFPPMPDEERPPSPAPDFPERRPQRPVPNFPLMADARRPRQPALHFPLFGDERRPQRPAAAPHFPAADGGLPQELADLFPRAAGGRRPQRPALNIPFIANERRPNPQPVNVPLIADERPHEEPAPILPMEAEERPPRRPLLQAEEMPRRWLGIRRPRQPGPARLPAPRPPPWPPPLATKINNLLHLLVTSLKVGAHRVFSSLMKMARKMLVCLQDQVSRYDNRNKHVLQITTNSKV